MAGGAPHALLRSAARDVELGARDPGRLRGGKVVTPGAPHPLQAHRAARQGRSTSPQVGGCTGHRAPRQRYRRRRSCFRPASLR